MDGSREFLASGGVLPYALKEVVVQPLLKWFSLYAEVFKNYHTDSNIHFLGNVIKRVMTN